MNYIETIGYLGSVLIALSLMMKNIYYLRRINLLGASTFAVYGLLVGAIPVFALNSFITIVDIYYIMEAKRRKEYFTLLSIKKGNCPLLNKFIEYYEIDIKKYFPYFNINQIDEAKSFFILRNMIPVGLFAYKELSEHEILIKLDYAIPDYRDLKNARFVYFAQSNHFKKRGYNILNSETEMPEHRRYLLKIGFIENPKNSGKFSKNI